MIRYLCDYCGSYFDKPSKIHHRETVGEFTREYVDEVCPFCGCDSLSHACDCPKCGKHMYAGARLCDDCQKSLLERLTEFADGLTAEEEQQVDDWMDGDTITNRRNWT